MTIDVQARVQRCRWRLHRNSIDRIETRGRSILPEDLIDIVTDNGLHYSHRTESGVLFHLVGALSEFGKLGITVIANSQEEVDQLYRRALTVLDAETRYGQ